MPLNTSGLHLQAWQKPDSANQRDAGTNYVAQVLRGTSYFSFNNFTGQLLIEEKQKGPVLTQVISTSQGVKQRLFHELTSTYSSPWYHKEKIIKPRNFQWALKNLSPSYSPLFLKIYLKAIIQTLGLLQKKRIFKHQMFKKQSKYVSQDAL